MLPDTYVATDVFIECRVPAGSSKTQFDDPAGTSRPS